MSNKIVVAGIGPGSVDYISPLALKKIKSAKILVGGGRALSDFAEKNQTTFQITSDLDAVINFVREKILFDEVVVMASGDPGYFSILDLLKKNFSSSQIEVIPSISSMQLAFAKLSLSWHSATLASFHGRQPADEEINFCEGKILGLLTDSKFNSATISKILIEHGWDKNSDLVILTKLSYPDEKIIFTDLGDAINSEPIKHGILIAGENIKEVN